jgi:hypothetical protein
MSPWRLHGESFWRGRNGGRESSEEATIKRAEMVVAWIWHIYKANKVRVELPWSRTLKSKLQNTAKSETSSTPTRHTTGKLHSWPHMTCLSQNRSALKMCKITFRLYMRCICNILEHSAGIDVPGRSAPACHPADLNSAQELGSRLVLIGRCNMFEMSLSQSGPQFAYL